MSHAGESNATILLLLVIPMLPILGPLSSMLPHAHHPQRTMSKRHSISTLTLAFNSGLLTPHLNLFTMKLSLASAKCLLMQPNSSPQFMDSYPWILVPHILNMSSKSGHCLWHLMISDRYVFNMYQVCILSLNYYVVRMASSVRTRHHRRLNLKSSINIVCSLVKMVDNQPGSLFHELQKILTYGCIACFQSHLSGLMSILVNQMKAPFTGFFWAQNGRSTLSLDIQQSLAKSLMRQRGLWDRSSPHFPWL